MDNESIEHLRESAYELARHEAGHFVVARALGYPSDEVYIVWSGTEAGGNGGNNLSLDRSFENLDEAAAYCSDRVIMLYAGAMAENVLGGRVIDERVCDDLDTPKAADDFSKVRENIRIIVGAKLKEGEDPEVTTRRTNDQLWQRATGLVIRFDREIEALAKELQLQIIAAGQRAVVRNWTQPELGAGLEDDQGGSI